MSFEQGQRSMAKNLAELRVVIKDGDKYALAGYMAFTKTGDIYCGPGSRSEWLPKIPSQSLRTSYHKDGNVFLRTIEGFIKLPSLDPPVSASGFKILTSVGHPIYDEDFSRQALPPKSRIRTTRIIERSVIPHSSVSI